MNRKKGSKTSSFGSPGRESHDSSAFYNGRMYEDFPSPPRDVDSTQNPVPFEVLDRILLKSSERMDELPDSSVHLMVTSPPYNVQKEYDRDLSFREYRTLLRSVLDETFRVLVDGGRACINVANVGRKPYIPLHAFLIQDMLELGFLMRGEVIWNKGSSAGSSTAWGSWMSASNPVLRDVHEYILIFSKGSFSRKEPELQSTISREQFLEWTKSVWDFPTVSARKIGHPAPFPIELPARLIQLFTYHEEVLLDPFCGAGTSCLAAMQAGRHFVGYEINQDYYDLALERIHALKKQGPAGDSEKPGAPG
jgi:site-specific DNA-methyltransferase (adenine-specific)